jgi:hypothetical protein
MTVVVVVVTVAGVVVVVGSPTPSCPAPVPGPCVAFAVLVAPSPRTHHLHHSTRLNTPARSFARIHPRHHSGCTHRTPYIPPCKTTVFCCRKKTKMPQQIQNDANKQHPFQLRPGEPDALPLHQEAQGGVERGRGRREARERRRAQEGAGAAGVRHVRVCPRSPDGVVRASVVFKFHSGVDKPRHRFLHSCRMSIVQDDGNASPEGERLTGTMTHS